MQLLTPVENRFLEVFLHEATTSPFTGPATMALHKIGVEYGDISHIAWAYEQDVPRTGFTVGNAAAATAPAPLANRLAALLRNEEIQLIWERRQEGSREPPVQNDRRETRVWSTKWALGRFEAHPARLPVRPLTRRVSFLLSHAARKPRG